MKLIGKQVLHDFIEKHADARSQVESWEAEVEEAQWGTPLDIKARYPNASILKGQQVIFDICRDRYRLWVHISYQNGVVLIKKVGSHKEYDKWDTH